MTRVDPFFAIKRAVVNAHGLMLSAKKEKELIKADAKNYLDNVRNRICSYFQCC